MNSLADYERQKKVDTLAWDWLPRGAGFWSWFAATLYLWRSQMTHLDRAATTGLVIGIVVWIVAKFLARLIGTRIIYLNLWENGCGCIVRTISIELFQYIAIAFVCVLTVISDDLTTTTALLFFFIGSLNWFLISFKNL